MKVEIREAKSIITKSKIPTIDFVINPYTGCQHGCIYCYAEFMIRFTGHKGEKWGDFLDIKKYDFNKIKPSKYDGKKILLSSVTDPYLPLEKKYENTKKILRALIGTTAEIQILTKSKLVTRDIDLFKKFENIKVGISLNTLDDVFSRVIEPAASKPSDRLMALKKIAEEGIDTYVFISPFFPEITDFEQIIEKAVNFTTNFSFENLNFRTHNIHRINKIITKYKKDLLSKYKKIQKESSYWDFIEMKIKKYCEQKELNYHIEFHHGGFSKS
ncbi:MAG: radical SAM protein [Candidatus Lokiarchaeota archaeon]|nr:radical SAM protein [Candidatus Lokiarchaeota archaeon]MBD3198770.1 radical SAM protein [Candidatus Lokiarchaeota archaeon]